MDGCRLGECSRPAIALALSSSFSALGLGTFRVLRYIPVPTKSNHYYYGTRTYQAGNTPDARKDRRGEITRRQAIVIPNCHPHENQDGLD